MWSTFPALLPCSLETLFWPLAGVHLQLELDLCHWFWHFDFNSILATEKSFFKSKKKKKQLFQLVLSACWYNDTSQLLCLWCLRANIGELYRNTYCLYYSWHIWHIWFFHWRKLLALWVIAANPLLSPVMVLNNKVWMGLNENFMCSFCQSLKSNRKSNMCICKVYGTWLHTRL